MSSNHIAPDQSHHTLHQMLEFPDISGKIIFNQLRHGIGVKMDLSVLIVDDEPTNLNYLEALLKRRVKEVDHACNGKLPSRRR